MSTSSRCSRISRSSSNMIVVDQNLYFNDALTSNISFTDLYNMYDQSETVDIERTDIKCYDINEVVSDREEEKEYKLNRNKKDRGVRREQSLGIVAVKILKSGYLRREAKTSKKWKKRWIVLQSDGKLLCYNNKKDLHLMETLKCNHLTQLSSKSYSNKRQFGIKLSTPRVTLKLSCLKQKSRIEWITAFETV